MRLVGDPEVVEELERDFLVAGEHEALGALLQQPRVEMAVEVRVGRMDDVEQHSHA